MAEDEALIKVPFRIQTSKGVLEASVQTTQTPITVISVIGAARGLEDALIGMSTREAEETGAPVTCQRGCDACCHHLVPVSPIEAHAITAMIDTMPEERRKVITARFDDAKEKAAAADLLESVEATLTGEPFDRNTEWFAARIPCPFLEQHQCTIYADRPLACREHLVSSSPAACSDAPTTVRRVPLLGQLARSLARLSSSVWPEAPPQIPLILAPRWGRARAEAASARRSGVALLEALLGHL